MNRRDFVSSSSSIIFGKEPTNVSLAGYRVRLLEIIMMAAAHYMTGLASPEIAEDFGFNPISTYISWCAIWILLEVNFL
ncbi:hypothetical protein SERLA73DRAFT_142209, partial [Serpula lacrymans var. lacrymans S7.3]